MNAKLRDQYGRRPGARWCCVAGCPHRLGDSFFRYCAEHLPADAKRRAKAAAAEESATRSADDRVLAYLRQMQRPVGVRHLIADCQLARSTAGDTLQRLIFRGLVARPKVGQYVLVEK